MAVVVTLTGVKWKQYNIGAVTDYSKEYVLHENSGWNSNAKRSTSNDSVLSV